MGQILSQSEIDAILTGLDLDSHSSAGSQKSSSSQATPYDFEHPEPLRRAQFDSLTLAAMAGSQALQTSLSRILLAACEVKFLSVEQSTYRDYVATAETPGCLAVFEAANSSDSWLLDIGRPFSFAMIDCLLGGQPFQTNPDTLGSRPYTDVEIRLISRAMRTIVPDLAGTFTRHTSLRLTNLIAAGSCLREASLNDAVALVSFEIAFGQNRCLIQLCAPWKDVAFPGRASGSDGRQFRFDHSGAVKIPVVATARVASLKLTAKDLTELSPGDVLLTDVSATQEISFDVDGRTLFRGNPGQSDHRKVIRLTKAVEAATSGSHDPASTEKPI